MIQVLLACARFFTYATDGNCTINRSKVAESRLDRVSDRYKFECNQSLQQHGFQDGEACCKILYS